MHAHRIKIAAVMAGLVLVVASFNTIQNVAQAASGPTIRDFRFEPDSFALGETVQLSFAYENVKGGLGGARISLEYRGSLAGHSRKASIWASSITGDQSEYGAASFEFPITPTDSPPFTINYYLRITDTEGRKSEWAEATVRFTTQSVRASKPEQTAMAVTGGNIDVTRRLVAGSPFKGKWKVANNTRVKGTLDLIFENVDGQLTARVVNSTGASYSFDGPVKDLVIKDDQVVRFTVSSGAPYRLKFNEDGELEGDARKGVALIHLTPTSTTQ